MSNDSSIPTEVLQPQVIARTSNFQLGAPRGFTIAPDSSRVAFLRSSSGEDRLTELWVYDLRNQTERRIADPRMLMDGGSSDEVEKLDPSERARRERVREAGTGIVNYAVDRDVRIATFALSSRLWIANLETAEVIELRVPGPVVDPRVDPNGRYVAYTSAGALLVASIEDGTARSLVEPESETVAWGSADFIAAEEFGRSCGYWWSPDASTLLVERYDEVQVELHHIAEPMQSRQPPAAVRYPAAGTPNALVALFLVGLDGSRREVKWDHAKFPYLTSVSWSSHRPPLVQVLARDQRRLQILSVSVSTGLTEVLQEQVDQAWIEIVPGLPQWLPDGRLVSSIDEDDTRRLTFGGSPVTAAGWQLSAVLGIDETGVVVAGTAEPTEQHIARVDMRGTCTSLTSDPGVHRAWSTNGVTVIASQGMNYHGVRVRVFCGQREIGRIASRQWTPPYAPNVSLITVGSRSLRTAVLFPRGHLISSVRLPVLLDPYGGPHRQRVRAARGEYLTPQWFADQGFCVVVADGRGTPNRGPAWEREVQYDLVGTVDDQAAIIEELRHMYPDDADTSRVAIRGWSFGGYVAAAALLHRPDIFHTAIAGAPVTDWRLYDTAYSERYLGHPDENTEVYVRNSLIGYSGRLKRPLLLIHGLADDNVLVAHTLRLSSALLSAGRLHSVLPLSGVTHAVSRTDVMEKLLVLELKFLRMALNIQPL